MSKYFTLDEMRCHDEARTPYPAEWVGDRLTALFATLDEIREAWGGPLIVVSGYRTAAYNAELAAKSSGVAKDSQHIQGRAADVRPVDRERVPELHALVLKLHGEHRLPRLAALGLYPGWIHVDVRYRAPGAALVRW